MEKRISFFEFQSVKSVAKAIEPKLREQAKIKSQMEKLAEEYKKCDADIAAYEAGIVNVIGFHVQDLVKKTYETRVGKNGEEIKVSKYVPADNVTYDEATKEFVVTVPDEGENVEAPMTTVGNDFDADGSMPFDAPKDEEEVF